MRRQRGLTLIEVLLATVLTALVLGGVLGIFGFVMRQWGGQVSRSNALQAANLGMDRMTKEMRHAILYESVDAYGVSNVFTFPNNKDSAGNYVPAWSGGKLQYQPGTRVRFYLSDTTGDPAVAGPILWREYLPVGGSWTIDSAWSLQPGSSARGQVANVTELSFSTTGMPANTVRVALTIQVREGSQTTAYTVKRDVYLSNHN